MRSFHIVALASVCVVAAMPAFAKGHAPKHRRVLVAQGQQVTIPPMTPPPPPARPNMTLNEALAVTYETNPQLAAAEAGLRATDEGVAQANGGWRPTVAVGATYGVNRYFFPGTVISPAGTIPPVIFSSVGDHPIQGAATITQPIFRSGRTVAEISKAKALMRAGRAQLLATEQTVLLNAVTAYMNVVRDTAIANLRGNNVEVLRKQRDATQLEFKAGALTRTDVAQSEARLAGAQADLTTARGQLEASHADFVQQVGRPAETLEANPELPVIPGSSEDVLGLALKQNPALVNAREQELAANYAVNDAWGAMGPTFSIQGQYGYSSSDLNSFSGVGAIGGTGTLSSTSQHALTVTGQLNVPIYQAGVEEATIREARELHAQTQMNVSVADRQVRDAVATAWSNFQSAEATIASNEATQKADEIAYEGVYKEQQVGGRTILDVLNAEQELLNAQVTVVTSHRDAIVAAYQVLAAGGALTAKALGLKVKLYDPIDHYEDDAGRWIGFGDFDLGD